MQIIYTCILYYVQFVSTNRKCRFRIIRSTFYIGKLLNGAQYIFLTPSSTYDEPYIKLVSFFIELKEFYSQKQSVRVESTRNFRSFYKFYDKLILKCL